MTTIIDFQTKELQVLTVPWVTNTNTVSQSQTSTKGKLCYDDSVQKLYYGNGSAFLEVGGASTPITISNTVVASNNQALLLTGNILQAQEADILHPGIVTTATQGFTGYKLFPTGLSALRADITAGADNVSILGNVPLLGQQNIAIGKFVMDGITGNPRYNIAIGFQTLYNATTNSEHNIGMGRNALYALTTGADNIALGDSALSTATSAGTSIAIGSGALELNETGVRNIGIGVNSLAPALGSDNTVIGVNACGALTTGEFNCCLGNFAGNSLTTGNLNTFLGYNSGDNISTTSNNICINNPGLLGDANVVRIGDNTLGVSICDIPTKVYIDNDNTRVGHTAMATAGTHTVNTAVGYRALGLATNSSNNVAIGSDAMLCSTGNAAICRYNTCVGVITGRLLDSGIYNTFLGFGSGVSATNTIGNTSVGADSLRDCNALGHTAMGYEASKLVTAQYCSSFGYQALKNNITGANNSAFGYQCMSAATGSENTAFGHQALYNSSSTNNSAFGYRSSISLTSGNSCTSMGSNSLAANLTGNNCTAIGYQALAVSTASNNTAMGYNAGAATTTGQNNTIIGRNALSSNITGSGNTILGNNCAANIVTATNNIIIGDAAGSSLNGTNTNNILIGASGSATTDSQIRIGSGSQTKCFITAIRGVTTDVVNAIPVLIDSAGQLGTVSSKRELKENIVDIDREVNHNKLMGLKPRQFNFKARIDKKPEFGLIVEEAYDSYEEICVLNHGDLETVYYNQIPVLNLTEIQRLNTIIDLQELRIKKLEQRLDELLGCD